MRWDDVRRKRAEPETDAQQFTRLEMEWGTYGPLRPVVFEFTYTDFGEGSELVDKEAADHTKEVERLLRDGGMEANSWVHETKISFAMDLKPSLEAITGAKEKILAYLGSERVRFEHWNYGRHFCVNFYRANRANMRQNDISALNRGRALFGERPVEDPLDKSTGRAFEIDPRRFLDKARRQAPADPAPTASAFSQWVYSLYSNARGDEDDRERGKGVEEEVWSRRRDAEASLHSNRLRDSFPMWRLVHNGLHLAGKPDPVPMVVSGLEVRGMQLRVSPDLVYRHTATEEVVVVELKNSFMPLPSNLWPNLWAQLWCYSRIDIALHAPKVTVVGEVWVNRRVYRRHADPLDVVSLRASVRRDPRTPAYDRFFGQLFDIYRGTASH